MDYMEKTTWKTIADIHHKSIYYYGNIIFCNESPLFETITKKEVPK